MSKFALVALLLMLASGCGPSTNDVPESAQSAPEPFASEQVELFPTAVAARLVAFENGAPLDEQGEMLPVASTGEALTSEEAVRLQTLIRTAPHVDPSACACVIRHVFSFYDASGAKVGDLGICLECHCALRTSATSGSTEWLVNGYEWDESVVRTILAAHQTPTFD